MTSQDWIKLAEEFENPFTADGTRKEITRRGLCMCAERLGFPHDEVRKAVRKHTGKYEYICGTWAGCLDKRQVKYDKFRARVAREIAAELAAAAELEKGQAL